VPALHLAVASASRSTIRSARLARNRARWAGGRTSRFVTSRSSNAP